MKNKNNITALDIVNSINHLANELKIVRMEIEALNRAMEAANGHPPKHVDHDSVLFSSREFARACKVSSATVRKWVKEGKVKPLRLSERCLRFSPSQVIMGTSN